MQAGSQHPSPSVSSGRPSSLPCPTPSTGCSRVNLLSQDRLQDVRAQGSGWYGLQNTPNSGSGGPRWLQVLPSLAHAVSCLGSCRNSTNFDPQTRPFDVVHPSVDRSISRSLAVLLLCAHRALSDQCHMEGHYGCTCLFPPHPCLCLSTGLISHLGLPALSALPAKPSNADGTMAPSVSPPFVLSSCTGAQVTSPGDTVEDPGYEEPRDKQINTEHLLQASSLGGNTRGSRM